LENLDLRDEEPEQRTKIKLFSEDVQKLKYYLNLIKNYIPRLDYEEITKIGDQIFYVINGMMGSAKDPYEIVKLEELESLTFILRIPLSRNPRLNDLFPYAYLWNDDNRRERYNSAVRGIYKILDGVEIIEKEMQLMDIMVEFDLLEKFLHDDLERGLHCETIYRYCNRIASMLLQDDKLSKSQEILKRVYQIRNRLLENLTNLKVEIPDNRPKLLSKTKMDFEKLSRIESIKEFEQEQIEAMTKEETTEKTEKAKPTEKPKE